MPSITVRLVAERSGTLSSGGPDAERMIVLNPPPEHVALSVPDPPSLAVQPAVSAPPVELAEEMSSACAGAAMARPSADAASVSVFTVFPLGSATRFNHFHKYAFARFKLAVEVPE